VLILSLVLLLGLSVGHATLMVGWHNWFYGQHLPRGAGKIFHLVFGFLTILGPVAWLVWAGPDVLGFLEQADWTTWSIRCLGAYLLACALAGFVMLPWITVKRHRRPRPATLVAETWRTIDVAQKLGFRPLGRGHVSLLARLPGNEIFKVEMAEKTLWFSRLPPAWEGLTILHLSDLHMCGTPGRDFYRIAMQLAAEWEPDIVALTGDIVDSIRHHGWILPALGWLRWKVAAFAILGNHDYWYEPPFIRRRLTRLGMHYLGNNWHQIDVRGEPLVVIGQEQPWSQPGPDLIACPQGPFRLCLSHTPDNYRWARRNGVDLMLSGHVHGGQIRFPVLGSLLVPSLYGRRYDCGTFQEGNTVLHVNRGLAGDHPIRYGCSPEVTLLRLTGQPGVMASR
jgi:uncharacterized protein